MVLVCKKIIPLQNSLFSSRFEDAHSQYVPMPVPVIHFVLRLCCSCVDDALFCRVNYLEVMANTLYGGYLLIHLTVDSQFVVLKMERCFLKLGRVLYFKISLETFIPPHLVIAKGITKNIHFLELECSSSSCRSVYNYIGSFKVIAIRDMFEIHHLRINFQVKLSRAERSQKIDSDYYFIFQFKSNIQSWLISFSIFSTKFSITFFQ
jgi:hypothetical protein